MSDFTYEEMDIFQILDVLALSAQNIAINKLKESWSKDGYKSFIFDLLGQNHSGSGWSVKGGYVNINPYPVDEIQSQSIASEINEYFLTNLGSKTWFQPYNSNAAVKPETSLLTPFQDMFPKGFKILGQNGANLAVDPTIFVTHNEDIRVLSIIRPDKKRALPGGMLENEHLVQDKCVDEILEECFSGKFFAPESITSELADQNTLFNEENGKLLKALLNTHIIKTCSELSVEQKETLVRFVEQQEITNASTAIQSIINLIQNMQLSTCAKAQTIAHIKVELYKKVCFEQYNTVNKLFKEQMTIGDWVANASDPRTTAGTGMVTRTVCMTANQEEIFNTFQLLGLEKDAAGDDASHAHFPTLYEFCCSEEHETFSDHAKLVLSALNEQIKLGKIPVTPNLINEIRLIAENFIIKDPDNKDLDSIVTTLNLNTVTPEKVRFFYTEIKESDADESQLKRTHK